LIHEEAYNLTRPPVAQITWGATGEALDVSGGDDRSLIVFQKNGWVNQQVRARVERIGFGAVTAKRLLSPFSVDF
jgi:hypothetical protein